MKNKLFSEFGKLAAKKRWSKLSSADVLRMKEISPLIKIRKVKPLNQRFWEKVDKSQSKDDCWEWNSCRHYKGYGIFRYNGKTGKAHRFSWELHNGKIPNGLFVCHHCDNPPCVNPSHLFLGTVIDNVRDSLEKGRFVSSKKGETHFRAIFTEKQVLEIRELYKKGFKPKFISEKFHANKGLLNPLFKIGVGSG